MSTLKDMYNFKYANEEWKPIKLSPNALHTNAYDEAITTPTEESARVVPNAAPPKIAPNSSVRINFFIVLTLYYNSVMVKGNILFLNNSFFYILYGCNRRFCKLMLFNFLRNFLS